MDLGGLVAARRWVTLAELLHGLRASSHTWAAMLNDSEVAEELAKLPQPKQHGRPQMSPLENTTLVAAIERQTALIAGVLGAKKYRPPEVVTALTAARAKAQQAAAEEIIAAWAPHALD